MFPSLTFRKTGAEVKTAAAARVKALREQLALREQKLEELAQEAGMHTAADILVNLDSFEGQRSRHVEEGVQLGVNVQAAIAAEVAHLRRERSLLAQFETVAAHVQERDEFSLSFEEVRLLWPESEG